MQVGIPKVSVVSPVTLIEIHRLPHEYGIIAEDYTERHVRYLLSPMTKAGKNRHYVRTSRTISQKMVMLAACPVSARTAHRCLQQRGFLAS